MSSIPKEDAAASRFKLDKRMVVKITPVEDRIDDLRNKEDEDLQDRQEKDESLPSPTVKPDDGSDGQQVRFNVESKTKVNGKFKSARPEKEPSGSTTSTDCVVKTQAEFIDIRIDDSVAALSAVNSEMVQMKSDVSILRISVGEILFYNGLTSQNQCKATCL